MTTARGMTPEELKEARRIVADWSGDGLSSASDVALLARYCRELERHAEAMAEGLGDHFPDDPKSVRVCDGCKALAAYRKFRPNNPEGENNAQPSR